MRLNHLNLCVEDLSGARRFFEDCFDFQTLDQKGDAIVVMSDGEGFTLVLSKLRPPDGQPQRYPDNFHLGFLLDAPALVDQAYQRLAAADVHIGHEPRKIRGDYGFYFTALNGILFEVSSPL